MENFETRTLIREILRLKARIRELESQEPSDSPEYFVASRMRKRFHRPSCVWATYFLDSPSLIEFYSHGEAVEAGYKPCGTCRA